MPNYKSILIIFKFFFKKLFKSKKTKFFIFFGLTPLIVFLLINGIKLLYDSNHISGYSFFNKAGMIFFFKLYIQLVSLLFGASVINDEVDSKTLVYLNTSPASKLSIISGKFAAYFCVSYLSFVIGSSLLFVITNSNRILSAEYISRLIKLEFAGLISILAYSSLFLLLGVSMKKSTILGVFYIFGWEGIVQALPGAAQKLSILFYIGSLTPYRIPQDKSILASGITLPGFSESLLTLVFLSTFLLFLSIYIFKNKEYLLADHT